MLPEKILRKLITLQCAAIIALSAHAAYAGNLGVNLNINLGEPRQVVVPQPVYVAPPDYAAPPDYESAAPLDYAPPVEPIRVQDDIHFVYPDSLGFYIAVGVPYDLFYLQNSYFLYRDGRWLRAPSSRGPWVVQSYRDLPRGLRRHRLERIREYRNREYLIYNRDRDHYRGRHFRSGREQWKREAKELRRDERRFDKEERHDEKRFEKEQRKEEKRFEKEERREHRGREGRGD